MTHLQIALLAACMTAATSAAGAPPVNFSAEDVFELEYAADPRLSPDGSQVVYERRSNDIMTDATRSNLWLVDVDSGEQRPLVSGTMNASSARWSPDGERIAWLQPGDHGTGIRVRWLANGREALLATLRESPSSLTWSPDGERLAFVMPVPAETEPLAKPPSPPEGAEWAEPAQTIEAVVYRRDGQGFLEPAYTHVFVLPADGGTPRQLTSGDFDHDSELSFSPDGTRIYLSANRDDGWELEPVERDIWSVAVADGALTQVTSRAGGESAPRVSPDGERIAYLYDDARKVPYRQSVLHVADMDGSNDRALTNSLDRSVSDIAWAANGRRLYVQYDDRAVRKVARVALDGDIETVATNLGGTSIGRPYLSGSYSVADNGRLVITHGTPYRPADVALVARGETRRLTRLNDDLLANRNLGQVHEINYESSLDGQAIQGWYVTPPDYDPARRYPLILEIHGGPHLAYGPQFSAEIQRYAAAGYVVFYDNHRGSSSYGEDFGLLLQYKYSSEEDFADHMSGIDALIARGIADEDRLYITGGSAGGIASAYAIGLTDRFRAAAVAKPVINWVSKTLTADSYTYQIPYQFPGMPWEEPEHYWQRSPLSLVGNVTTPTLLITGEDDYRTPISETEQFYQALKLRRVDSAMVRIPGSSHGIAGKPSRLNAKVDNILAWFERYADSQ
ncbi:MAG: S9 family peptidase [Woeseiaceae bacterium]|nr:S9 family peptidase [Woeseiaceae bacterium]